MIVAPAISAAAAIVLSVLALFGLPLAESSSEAATQAPSASFHTERYDLFIALTSYQKIEKEQNPLAITHHRPVEMLMHRI
ncbi:hypothetical protein [Burkholderia ubonensis]|uniref:hypothetical protein n=1 Tax=Burkholderia ubonensis TaxID=101571 RepID=UPI001E46B567|nr:hypothetical protein [Burkholderia ubonensis]